MKINWKTIGWVILVIVGAFLICLGAIGLAIYENGN